MHLTPSAYAFLGLTAIVAGLIALLTFTLLRFVSAARDTRRSSQGGSRAETAILSAALQEAVTKLKAQERATAARAEASERLSGEIIASLTAGLIVVDVSRQVQIINPAARRMLNVLETAAHDDYRRVLREPALSAVI